MREKPKRTVKQASFEIPEGGDVRTITLTTEKDQDEFLDIFYDICPRAYNEALYPNMDTEELIEKLCQSYRTEVRFVYERYQEKYVPWGGKGKP